VLIAGLIVSLALPAIALAGILVLHGPAGSARDASIDITLVTKHGHPLKLTRFEFNNIPANCPRYGPTAVSATFPRNMAVSSKNSFGATAKLRNGRTTYTVQGRFAGIGKASGTLRITGTVPGCVSVDTGVVRWSATKT
jgi:hypothetical protein